jgi:hypothetical protein
MGYSAVYTWAQALSVRLRVRIKHKFVHEPMTRIQQRRSNILPFAPTIEGLSLHWFRIAKRVPWDMPVIKRD